MSRPIITRTTIDDLLGQGRTELVLEPGAIVTALAREYAQDRGLRLVESAQPVAAAPSPDQIRSAVVARLGHEPDNLTQTIDRVLNLDPPTTLAEPDEARPIGGLGSKS